MSDDLIAFLRDRLAEDEQLAQLVTSGPDWRTVIIPDRSGPATALELGGTYDRVVLAGFDDDDLIRPAEAEHIARWDPARVLAEVEAKRRILGRYEDALARQTDPDHSSYAADAQVAEYEDWVIPALLLPYASHPDYREEWRP